VKKPTPAPTVRANLNRGSPPKVFLGKVEAEQVYDYLHVVEAELKFVGRLMEKDVARLENLRGTIRRQLKAIRGA